MNLPFFAPFDGKIVEFKSSGSEGSGGNDIWIQHNKYPNVFARFFHIKGSEKLLHFGTETVSTLFFLIKSILGFPSNSEPLHISGEFIGTGAGDVSLEILDYLKVVFFVLNLFQKLPVLWFSPQCKET